MAYHSDYNFVGCYDHGPQAGMLHVANHHLVPGKKQWTWGNGDFGKAWDSQLTDENGPYIELMCGAFTDNQPDFTWLMPGEEKSFTQTFMPYKDIGSACNASRDWVLNLNIETNEETTVAHVGVYAAIQSECVIELWHSTTTPPSFHNHKNLNLTSPHRPLNAEAVKLFEYPVKLDAASSWQQTVNIPRSLPATELSLRVVSSDQKTEYLAYSPALKDKVVIPSPASPAQPPEEIETIEELFLNGQHLEQYRHATYHPEPYYEEALRRDPHDSRCQNAMGLRRLRQGKFEDAESHFRTAITRLTQRNPNPYDGEAYYNLGLSLRFQERNEEAFDAFYKAVWSEAWKSPAYFELARLAACSGRLEEALELVDESIARNSRHQKANHLRIAILRHLGRVEQAREIAEHILRIDPLDPGARWEIHVEQSSSTHSEPNQFYNDVEIGLDYLHAGLFEEADTLFTRAANGEFLALYFLGWSALKQHRPELASERFRDASNQDVNYAFPNLLECIPALQAALELNPQDALAAYALGNFWYAHRRHDEAIACWEKCTRSRPEFPTAWRNLGLAYMNKMDNPTLAGEALRKAFANNPNDARVFYELDQFYKETAQDPAKRLALLVEHAGLTQERDDLCVEYLNLLNHQGQAKEALAISKNRFFHPWEGGEGKTTAQYLRSLFLLSETALSQNRADEALNYLEQAQSFPENLGEGKLSDTKDNELHYRCGRILNTLGKSDEAKTAFELATEGISEPASAMFYNDQPPESIYFQGWAWRELDKEDKATDIFSTLINYADTHINETINMDYFAVSLPDFLVFDVDLTEQNRRHCLFMKLLGLHGLGEFGEARRIYEKLIAVAPDHLATFLLPDVATTIHP